ncbi:MAG TPA: LysM domain-containing protein [Gemmatimonadales bacterium]|jgi:LysM repeat protein|nr:LysM domain-containing protein [Gemmatimonadales bacterium]
MRRTTICRSDRVAVLALAATLTWRVLPAQDTTQIQQDTTQAVAAFQAQVPAQHTVSRGETLWSIAQMYFNDPLLWPEIYRLNTNVVEDPHWIYPGEVLNLSAVVMVAQGDTVMAVPQDAAAADTVSATPGDTIAAVVPLDTVTALMDTIPADTAQLIVEPPPPAVIETYETMFDRRRTNRQVVQDVLRAYTNQPYRPVRAGEFYAAGFLSENERLPWGRVLGATATPAIHRLSERTSATTFEEIAIRPPRNASYHVGDSLLLARIDRALEFGRWGEVVVPLGIARVTSVEEQQVLAQVVAQYGRIHDGHLAMPLEPFRNPGQVRPTPVEQGLAGKLLEGRDPHPIAGAQQFFFIDKGRSQGVSLGDVFEVFKPAAGFAGAASEEVRAVLMIVHTRERSSTGLLIQIIHPGLDSGMPVRLIKKMPS